MPNGNSLQEAEGYTDEYSINFISNSITFDLIFWGDGDVVPNEYSGAVQYKPTNSNTYTTVWGGSWKNQAYATIEITGGSDVTNSDLILWLEANATQVVPNPTISDLTGYTWTANSSPQSIGNAYIANYTFISPQISGTFNYFGANLHYGNGFFDLVLKDENNQDTTYSVFYAQSANTSLSPVIDGAGWYSRGVGASSATFTKLSEPPIIQITGGRDVTNAELISYLEASGTLTQTAPAATPSLNFGGSDVTLFLGSTYISKVYLGSTLLYETSQPAPSDNALLDCDGYYILASDGYLLTTPSYSITDSITNGTASGDSTIVENGTASVTIIPSSGYDLPSSVNVSGASYTYDSSTGVVSLSNPSGNVTISGECQQTTSGYSVTFSAPSYGGVTTTLTDLNGNALPSTIGAGETINIKAIWDYTNKETSNIMEYSYVSPDTDGSLIEQTDSGIVDDTRVATYQLSNVSGDIIVTIGTTSCLLAGTMIKMADNSLKDIKDIVAGDLIKQGDSTAEVLSNSSKKTSYYYKVTFSDSSYIKCTPNHPFMCKGKDWSCIDLSYLEEEYPDFEDIDGLNTLEVGDELMKDDGSFATITEIKKISRSATVYSIDVTGNNTYCANGLVTHNAPYRPCPH